jgi:hypothetical protein
MKRYQGLQVADVGNGVLVTAGIFGFPEVPHATGIGSGRCSPAGAVAVPPGIYVPVEHGAGPTFSTGEQNRPPWILLVSQDDGKKFYIGIGVWEIATQDYRITKL